MKSLLTLLYKNGKKDDIKKNKIKKIFYKIFRSYDNIFNSPWSFNDLERFKKTFTVTRNLNLKCWAEFKSIPRSNKIKLILNPNYFKKLCNGYKIGLFLHEICHLVNNGHPPKFWDNLIKLYKNLDFRDINCISFEKSKVLEYIKKDPTFNKIDHRNEILPYRVMKNLKKLNQMTKKEKVNISEKTWKMIKFKEGCKVKRPNKLNLSYKKTKNLEKSLKQLKIVTTVNHNKKCYTLKPIDTSKNNEKRQKRIIGSIKKLSQITGNNYTVPLK